MKLKSKIISRNLSKLDQINYMHTHLKCSSSMIIHSHTGQLPSIPRNFRLFEIVEASKLSIPQNCRFPEIVDSSKMWAQKINRFFSWNETLTYGEKFGQMTYLSQTLLISDITVDYAEYDESMQFRMISNMFPSGEYECPR